MPEGAVIGLVSDTEPALGEFLNAVQAAVIAIVCDSELQVESLRRAGSSILFTSPDPDLLLRVSDEIWWIRMGSIHMKGDAREVLPKYAQASVQNSPALQPSARRGDGRAELIAIDTLGPTGDPASIWNSGEQVALRVSVRFHAAVADPVVGIMIRTRIGMEVFGTNTELEKVGVGPCEPGDIRTVLFRFACMLCPQYYTITAASHDPDGVWHDWMEDAVAIIVADTRYTAGVANLRAKVEVSGSRE